MQSESKCEIGREVEQSSLLPCLFDGREVLSVFD